MVQAEVSCHMYLGMYLVVSHIIDRVALLSEVLAGSVVQGRSWDCGRPPACIGLFLSRPPLWSGGSLELKVTSKTFHIA